MCIMVLKEAIDYYTSNGSSVFCTLLDATKAFDKVDYCKIFRSLTKRDIPPTVLCLLLNMCTRQVTRVSWNGVFSPPFYCAMLCIRGTSHGPVSVRLSACLSVCH